MWDIDFRERIINVHSEIERKRLKGFLERQDLSLDKDIEYAFAVMDGEQIAAAGSFSGKILKCIAVDKGYKNMGLSAKIVTKLLHEEYSRGRTHLFVYTKPENKVVFSELGFHCLVEVPYKAVLMENRTDGIKKYIEELVSESEYMEAAAAIVVNCNPFTLGHKYLIEHAAAKCRLLHVFILWEDKSVFPSEIRYRLVKEGTEHLPNVVLHKGRDYIISAATFPTYFTKDCRTQADTHARIDLALFSEYIAPALGIRTRFVGEESCCKVTALYNEIMQELLPAEGINVQVVPRKLLDGEAISASRVRKLLGNGRLDEVKGLVPENTYDYLLSPEAGEIIKQIRLSAQGAGKGGNSRENQ